MQIQFYRLLVRLTRSCGLWFFSLVAGGIAAGYFIRFPRRVAVSVRFYRVLFPRRSRGYHIWCALRQFLDFTHVFRDRLLADEDPAGRLSATFHGWERLRDATRGCGGVLVMSHAGNWEVAARLLKQTLPDLKLMIFMGAKQREQIEGLQKRTVQRSDIRVVGVDETGGSPLDMVEAVRFVRAGGLVSLTGDRVWRRGQRTVAVRFLDRVVHLPAAPYVLAVAAGVPIYVFFALHTGGRRYHFSASPPICIEAADRRHRKAAIARAAQQYADLLADVVRRHPFQWHHFAPFWDGPEATARPVVGAR